MGYMPTSMHYDAITPIRIADTRPAGVTIDGDDQGGGPKTGLSLVSIARGTVMVARTAVLNVTVVDPQAWGYLTVFPCGSPGVPDASNVNYVRGQTVPNAVVAPVDGTGEVCIYSYAATHVLVDLSGWFTDGLTSMVPKRVVDTRKGIAA